MRIVYLTTVDSSVRYLLLDQLRYLAARGHDVHAICAPGPNVAFIEQAGVAVHAVDLTRRVTPWKDLHALYSIVRTLRQLKPDLVHTNTPKASLLGQYAALAAGIPHRVHTIHGLYLPAGAEGLRRRAFLALERITMWPAHAILSVSAEDVATCKKYSLCPSDRLRYLGQGIDVERFVPARPEERMRARAALGVPEDHCVVGMVGRMVREKGVLEFLAAAREIVKRLPKTTFIVIGDSDKAKADSITAEDLRRAESSAPIHFLGHRDDMPMMYWAMDLLLHPSHREGFPRAPIEASACGVAVIATDIRGCREAVRNRVNGLLVPARDAEALAEATCSLLADDEVRGEFGRRGREIALREFDQRSVFAVVEQTYAELS